MRAIVVISMVVAVVLAILLGLILASRIATPLRSLSNAMKRVSEGDLRVEVKEQGNDEIGTLGLAFRTLVEHLREVVGDVHRGAEAVSDSAKAVALSSNHILVDSRSQSESVTNTAATLEEISASISSVSGNTEHVHTLSEDSRSRA